MHGNCLVPMGYKENPQLANWVSTQRQEWKLLQTGKPCRITQEKIHKLDELGFSWEAVRGGKRKKRASAATAAEGATTVAKKKKATTKTSVKVATNANHEEEGIIPSGIATATEVHVDEAPIATASTEENWDDMYEALLQFKTKTGHTNVTNRYKDKPGLAGWVSNQRREYSLMKEIEAGIADEPNATCSLTEGRVRQLESIGFEFKARKPGRPAKVATATINPSASNAAVAPAPTGELKTGGVEEEVFADAVEIIPDAQEESAKEEKPTASSDTGAKKRVKKNIPKGNAGKVSAEVGGGVKDAAEMLYALGGLD